MHSSSLLTSTAFHTRATQVWWIKCRALTNKNWIDEGELPEEGLGELLLDDNATAQIARPGTSFTRPETNSVGPSPAVRPTSTGGRPLSGFVRPGSGLGRLGTGMKLDRAMTSRLGTAMTRPVTTSGRFVRLGTASLQSEPGGPFVNLERINMQKYAARPAMAKALCDYIFHVEHNPKKAVELCAAATQVANFKDWCWKARLGKGYFLLGLYREVFRACACVLGVCVGGRERLHATCRDSTECIAGRGSGLEFTV